MKVHININDSRWNDIKIAVEKITKTALILGNKGSEVSVTLTNDSEIQELNKKYRGINKPTNVLSFETGDDKLLGDVFISFDTVLREAKAENKTFENHAAHLLVHGALHLQGYDHADDLTAEKMESEEIMILQKMGIDDPYVRTRHCEEPKATKQSNKKFLIGLLRHFIPRNDGGMKNVAPSSQNDKNNSALSIKYLAFFFLGAMASYGFAPYYLWPLTLLSIGIMYYFTINNSALSIKHSAFLWGAGYGLFSFGWALSSISANDELFRQFWWFYPFGFFFIGIGAGLVFAMPFWMTRTSGYEKSRRVVAFALAWTFILWLREWFLTGFPWNPLANIWINFPVAQTMSIIGALGLTFITVLMIAAVVEFIKSKIENRESRIENCRMLLFTLPFFTSIVFFAIDSRFSILDSRFSNHSEYTKRVRIVQPAFDMNMKVNNRAAAEKIIDTLVELSESPILDSRFSILDLIVWPETSFPYTINSRVPMPALGVPLVVGATYIENGRVYNAMVLTDKDGNIVDRFFKFHLVPFGEYAPIPFIPTPANLSRGAGPQMMANFVPAICYEIIFSDSLVPRGARPDFILNITNDAWFGKLSGPFQHLDMTRRQAIETGLPVVRANYGGISAIIDANGRVVQSLGLGVRGVIDGKIPPSRHPTIYSRIGLNGMMLLIILLSAPFLIRRRKR